MDDRNLMPTTGRGISAVAAPHRVTPSVPPVTRTGRSRFPWRTVVVVAALAVGGMVAARLFERPPAFQPVTTAPIRGAVTRAVTATGVVNPELTIIVGSYVSGVIQHLSCDYNTEVKAGQVCGKIDPRPYQMIVDQDKAALGVAKAQLEKDRANLAYMKISFERNQSLAQRQFATQDAADNARNQFAQAQAQIAVDQAVIEERKAALEASAINLGYTDIVSPVDGTVVSRNVTQGQTVAASFQTPTLFLIATDLMKMQVDTNISESDIGGVKEGDKATFTVDAYPGRVFQGRVTQVRQSPQTVQNIVTYDAVISVDNRDLALKPGMTAASRIVIDQRLDVLRVPNQALRYSPRGQGDGAALPSQTPPHVWVLRDGVAVSCAVTTGLDDEMVTEITGGDLTPDDRVIVGDARANSTATAP